MRIGQHISKPVLAFVTGGIVLVALIFWFGPLHHEKHQPAVTPPPQPDVVSASATPVTNLPTATAAETGLPPVVPISLTNVVINAENGSWLRDKDYLLAPHKPQEFGGVEFLMDGMIQLQGRLSKEWKNRSYRSAVTIPLAQTNIVDGNFEVIQCGSNVASLHLLGGTRYGGSQDQQFAEVVWHYTDGTSRRTSILYLNHFRDWVRNPYEEPAHLPYPFAKVVWAVPYPSQPGCALRLYHVTYANPEPAKVVRQLELVSAMEDPTLFIVGLTLDPLKPGERPDDTPDLEPTDPNPPNQIQILVQTSDGQLLPQAKLRVQFLQHNSKIPYNTIGPLNTGAGGSAQVSYPSQDLDQLSISASHDDYGSRKMVWDLKGGDTIPASYTIKLGSGVNIGGIVTDESNSPIAEAKVSLYRFWMGGDEMNKKGEQADFPSQTVTTDAQGKWQVKGLPPELLDHIGFDVKHPDFIGTNLTVGANGITESQLRAGTLKTTLYRGLDVHGLITDENDNPISKATVWAGKKYYRDRQQTKSDGQGRFAFRNVSEGDMLFSVLAKGHAPDNKTINVHSNLDPIIFRLKAGSSIQAHVQDESGQPIASARVGLEGNPGEAAYDAYEFSTDTDSQGNFTWDGAPDEPMPFYVFQDGYEAKRGVKLAPNQDNIVTMHHCRQLQGLVLDADTGQPVTKFSVRTGHRPDPNSENIYGVIRDQSFSAPDGRFTLELHEENDNAVEVSSDDYSLQVQSFPEAQNGIVPVTVRLKPNTALHGIVTAPDGTPLPGVSVGIAGDGPGHGVFLQGSHLRSWSSDLKVSITDSQGQFTLGSPPETGGTVVAVGELGFASARVDQVRANPTLILQPFGRIEGTLKIGGQPGAGKDLYFSMDSSGINTDFNGYKTTTDDQGKFSFEKIPPGTGDIVRLIQTSPNSWTHSDRTSVTVQPGQTTQITLGDSGAVLKGTIRLETPLADGEIPNIQGALSLQMPSTPSFKYYAITVSPDGSFSVDDVAPGTYSLKIMATKPSNQPWTQQPFAQGQTTITVPDNVNPLSPINIGEIVLKSVPVP
jgi:hypothetical protein